MNDTLRRKWALLALVAGSGVAILDGSVVNLALPHMTHDLALQQWVSNAYLLSLSSLILLGGSLGDIFGRKRVYLVGVAGFGIVSLLCALAPSVEVLISLRILQGAFGALMVPGALAIITGTFPRQVRSHAIGQWTSWSSVAVIAAPLIGGGILAFAPWQWIFVINLPLTAFCYGIGMKYIEESRDQAVRKIDIPGALLGWAGLGSLIFGLIEGPQTHWNYLTIGAVTIGLLMLVLLVVWERRAADPMVKLSLFRSRNFSSSNLMTFLMYGALGGMSFALVIYLQETLHYSALMAGLVMLPTSILMILFSSKVGALAGKYGARLFMTVGPIISGVGMAWLSFLQPDGNFWLNVLPPMLVFGIGLTLMVAPLTATVMASVSDKNSGLASAINNAVARAAGLIVVAMLGLFGASEAYHFGMALVAVMAVAAGVISYIMIRPQREDLI